MKTFNILVSDERLKPVYDTVLKRLTARGMELSEEAEFTLVLETDEAMRPDSYRITGKAEQINVKADSLINVFAGVGAFLYSSKFDENGITYKRKKHTWSEIGYIKEVYIRGHRGHNQYVIVGAKGEAICVYNDTFTNRKHFNEYLSKKNISTNYSSK